MNWVSGPMMWLGYAFIAFIVLAPFAIMYAIETVEETEET
jgi:hypothetical protein